MDFSIKTIKQKLKFSNKNNEIIFRFCIAKRDIGNITSLSAFGLYSITHLILSYDFNQSINNLQNSITHLTLGYDFNQPINNLPNSIIHLTLGYDFNQPINNLSNSITESRWLVIFPISRFAMQNLKIISLFLF